MFSWIDSLLQHLFRTLHQWQPVVIQTDETFIWMKTFMEADFLFVSLCEEVLLVKEEGECDSSALTLTLSWLCCSSTSKNNTVEIIFIPLQSTSITSVQWGFFRTGTAINIHGAFDGKLTHQLQRGFVFVWSHGEGDFIICIYYINMSGFTDRISS